MANHIGDVRDASVTDLQAYAWAVANASYQVLEGEAYRAYARELYDEDLHERILALFARLDAQNDLLDGIEERLALSQAHASAHPSLPVDDAVVVP
jgi:hypothetical protein